MQFKVEYISFDLKIKKQEFAHFSIKEKPEIDTIMNC